MQRDRNFSDYEDLELAYELRPSYWIEPHEGWGEGRVELVELPTSDETNDNIVVAWAPKHGLDVGKSLVYGYRITRWRGSEPDAGRPHRCDVSCRAARVGRRRIRRRRPARRDSSSIFPAATCPIT